MKKILIILLLLTASTLIYSQSMNLNNNKIRIVDSTMGLGITPTSRLHVFGNGTASNLFNVTNDKDATKDSSVVIDAVGNAGIGVSAPTSKLEVADGYNGHAGSIPLAYFRTAINDKIAVLGSAETGMSPIYPAYNIGLYGTAKGGTKNFAGYFSFGDVYIKEKLGIGTETPAAALHIKGAEQIGNVNTLIADSVNALRLSGTATVWDDLMFPFSTGHQGNANYPPFNADSLYFEFSIDSTGSDAQFMYFIIKMPPSWKEGSTIYPHVHYKYETAVGACSFRMKYKWYNIGASTDVGWNWVHMNISTGSTDKTHIMASTYSGISGANKTISSILICKVYLYGVAGTGTCKAYQFDIHYEKDSMGSNSETSKN